MLESVLYCITFISNLSNSHEPECGTMAPSLTQVTMGAPCEWPVAGDQGSHSPDHHQLLQSVQVRNTDIRQRIVSPHCHRYSSGKRVAWKSVTHRAEIIFKKLNIDQAQQCTPVVLATRETEVRR